MGQFLPGEETKLLDAAEGHSSPTTPHAASGSSTFCSQEDKQPQEDSQEQFWERLPLMRKKGLEDSASSGFFHRVSGSARADLRGLLMFSHYEWSWICATVTLQSWDVSFLSL